MGLFHVIPINYDAGTAVKYITRSNGMSIIGPYINGSRSIITEGVSRTCCEHAGVVQLNPVGFGLAHRRITNGKTCI